jgi:hypothetical protein
MDGASSESYDEEFINLEFKMGLISLGFMRFGSREVRWMALVCATCVVLLLPSKLYRPNKWHLQLWTDNAYDKVTYTEA